MISILGNLRMATSWGFNGGFMGYTSRIWWTWILPSKMKGLIVLWWVMPISFDETWVYSGKHGDIYQAKCGHACRHSLQLRSMAFEPESRAWFFLSTLWVFNQTHDPGMQVPDKFGALSAHSLHVDLLCSSDLSRDLGIWFDFCKSTRHGGSSSNRKPLEICNLYKTQESSEKTALESSVIL